MTYVAIAFFFGFIVWLNLMDWKEMKRRREKLSPEEQARLKAEEEKEMQDFSF